MSDMKCPFCQQELEIGGVDGILRGCPKCRNLGTEMLWQELIKLMEEKQHKDTATDQQGEVWKDVVGYEGLYRISNQGTVCRLYKNGKVNFMTPRILNGYWRVKLCNGKQKTAYGYNWKYKQKDKQRQNQKGRKTDNFLFRLPQRHSWLFNLRRNRDDTEAD